MGEAGRDRPVEALGLQAEEAVRLDPASLRNHDLQPRLRVRPLHRFQPAAVVAADPPWAAGGTALRSVVAEVRLRWVAVAIVPHSEAATGPRRHRFLPIQDRGPALERDPAPEPAAVHPYSPALELGLEAIALELEMATGRDWAAAIDQAPVIAIDRGWELDQVQEIWCDPRLFRASHRGGPGEVTAIDQGDPETATDPASATAIGQDDREMETGPASAMAIDLD